MSAITEKPVDGSKLIASDERCCFRRAAQLDTSVILPLTASPRRLESDMWMQRALSTRNAAKPQARHV
jgi:hypothetical protein